MGLKFRIVDRNNPEGQPAVQTLITIEGEFAHETLATILESCFADAPGIELHRDHGADGFAEMTDIDIMGLESDWGLEWPNAGLETIKRYRNERRCVDCGEVPTADGTGDDAPIRCHCQRQAAETEAKLDDVVGRMRRS